MAQEQVPMALERVPVPAVFKRMPNPLLNGACLSYYSESNFEYSRSISDYSESIAQLSAVWYLTNASYSLASLDV